MCHARVGRVERGTARTGDQTRDVSRIKIVWCQLIPMLSRFGLLVYFSRTLLPPPNTPCRPPHRTCLSRALGILCCPIQALRVNVGGKLLTNYLKEVVSYRQWNMMDEFEVRISSSSDLS